MKTINDDLLSEAQYLELELRSPVRNEFFAGRIYPLGEVSLRHNLIAGNFAVLLRQHLRGSACRTFIANVKLRVAKTHSIYYPDVLVTCDPKHLSVGTSDHIIDTPRLVIEVLSESTASTDRREKLQAYRSLPSLIEYVLVSQDEAKIEIHRRSGDIGWQIATLTPGDSVELKSVELTTDFATIYEESGLAV